MAAVDTKKPAHVTLSAKSNAFQFNADSPSFVPNTSFDPRNLPSASTKKKLTFYSPSQFYPKQQAFYYANGYGADGAYYGAYDMFGSAPVEEEEEEEAEIIPDVIVFKNLPFSLTDDVLMKETIELVGTCIASVQLVRDKKGRFKGTAFVKFASIKDADGAMEKMNDVVIMGRQVKLERMHANGIKVKKKKKKKKKKKVVVTPPIRVKAPQSIDSPATALWNPAESHESNMHKVSRRKSRGNSDMDVNWRSKTAAAVDIEMPNEPESRALCQKLVEYKKSTTSKPTMITACTVDHLKQLIRVSNLLNLNHQIEEATDAQWKVKFSRKSFFESPNRTGKGDPRFKSWSSEVNSSLSRGARGVKASDAESSARQRHRSRTFSRDRTYSMRDRSVSFGSRKDRSESLVLYARGPDGTLGFKAGGRGSLK